MLRLEAHLIIEDLMSVVKMMMGIYIYMCVWVDDWCRDDDVCINIYPLMIGVEKVTGGYMYIGLKLNSNLAISRPEIHPIVCECQMASCSPLLEH